MGPQRIHHGARAHVRSRYLKGVAPLIRCRSDPPREVTASNKARHAPRPPRGTTVDARSQAPPGNALTQGSALSQTGDPSQATVKQARAAGRPCQGLAFAGGTLATSKRSAAVGARGTRRAGCVRPSNPWGWPTVFSSGRPSARLPDEGRQRLSTDRRMTSGFLDPSPPALCRGKRV